MKIVLINSRHSDTIVMPLGILYLAAVLRQVGHRILVFDPFFEDLSFIKKVKRFKPDLIGFSVLTATYDQVREMVGVFRQELPKTIICAGGIHPTALPEKTLEELNLDFVVFGEGEYTLREACERLEKGRSLEKVKGVVFKKRGKIVKNQPRELIANLDEVPFPARDLLDAENYLLPPGYIRSHLLARCLTVYTSRGCPFLCSFCASHLLFGRKIRRRTVENVLVELKMLKEKNKIDGVFFLDDTFTVDKNWVLNFCQKMKSENLGLIWGCQTRTTTVDEELLTRVKEAGCVQIDFGVESGSQGVLASLKKGQTPKDIKRAFRLAQKVGLRTFATVMVGSPEEKTADIKKTEKLLKEISPAYTHISFCTPLPGTELYEQVQKKGWVGPSFGNNWDFIKTNLPIMAINFSPKEMVAIRASLYNSFFWGNYRYFFEPRNLPFFLAVVWVVMLHPKKLFKAFWQFLTTKNIEDLIHAFLHLYHQSKMVRRVEKGNNS